ncbi:uncharacterized protein [Euphorbia lathyris]|uniref:uncharacterized protein isoform X3 n=1 Tax=Euphorbia lathyris TaxID=212925 RepID=UPI003313CF40
MLVLVILNHLWELASLNVVIIVMSAAAFDKGLFDLEGKLTPIMVSLVSKDSSMLDGLGNASADIKVAKDLIHWSLLFDIVDGYSPTLPHLKGLQNCDTATSAINQVLFCSSN